MRKKRIINKKFQLGLAFQVIALSVISFSLFAYLALMLMNTSGNFVSTERAEMAEKALGTQEKIIKSFMEYSRRADSGDVAVATELVPSLTAPAPI